MKHETIILGVDPGTKCTGWGVIRYFANQYHLIEYGTIQPKQKEMSEVYLHIFEEVGKLVERFCPIALSVETQYVHKNVQSAIKLGMARGAITIAAAKQGIPVFEYAPSKAKIAATGRGNATKEQVQKMVRLLLKLPEVPKPEDAADALALAICHAHYANSTKKFSLK